MKKMLYLGLVAVILFATFLQFSSVNAAGLTALSDTMLREQKSVTSQHTIVFTTPTGVLGASQTLIVTLPSDFVVGSAMDYTDVTLSSTTGGAKTLAAAADATHWGAAFSGTSNRVLTFTHATDADFEDIAAGDVVTIVLEDNATNHEVTNPTTAGSYTITISGTFGDTGQIAVPILDNDQVAVTGTVDPSISFSLSATAADFGSITSAAVRYATENASSGGSAAAAVAFSIESVNTNANNGLTITAESDNSNASAGLYSAITAEEITADDIAAVVAGTKGFALCGTNASSLTLDADFECETGTTPISTSPQQIASATGPISSGSMDVRLKVAVSGTTQAATDYATTLTIIATGNF